jgi:hypothetical protein
MPMLAAETTLLEWIGGAIFLLVFIALLGLLFWSVRSRHGRRKQAAGTDRDLPPEYRLRDQPTWFVFGGGRLFFGNLWFGRWLIGPVASGILVLLMAGILTTTVFLRRRQHQRRVIELVRQRASRMDEAELRALIEQLEAEHGKLEMRPLRRLRARDAD